MSHSEGIASFWSFWRANRDAITSAIDTQTLMDFTDAITKHVRAVHPKLDWEMGAGFDATHYFCVSAKGDMAVRVVAERWLAAAPPRDATWEFHAARPGRGAGDGSLDFEGVVFAMKDFRFVADPEPDRARVHVKVHHPAFAAVPDARGTTATFVALDNALGEDEVERWIGGIDICVDPAPEGARTFAELVALVAEFRTTHGEGRWLVLKGKLPGGGAVFISFNTGVRRVDHILMEQHVEVAITLDDPNDQGLTKQPEADALNTLEDALLEALGPDAVYIGRETREGLRVLHFHVAASGPAITRMEAFFKGGPREVEITSRLDPTWEILRRW